MQSALSFAPLHPVGFCQFPRGGARPAFCGAGRGNLFFHGAGRGDHPWLKGNVFALSQQMFQGNLLSH